MWWITGAVALSGLLLGGVLNRVAMRWDRGLASPMLESSITRELERETPASDHANGHSTRLLDWLMPLGQADGSVPARRWQYPLGVAAAVIVYPVSVAIVGMRWELLPLLWCVSILYIIVQTDLAERIIPDRIVLVGTAGMLAMRLWIHPLPLWDYLVASLVGSGALLLIGVVGQRLLRRETMGGGDIKLYVFIGLMLGWKLTLLSLFAASLIGLVVTVLLRLVGRGAYGELVPFGPYIAVGAWAVYLWGEGWLSAYLTWVQGLVATG